MKFLLREPKDILIEMKELDKETNQIIEGIKKTIMKIDWEK